MTAWSETRVARILALDAARLRELLSYDPTGGAFSYRFDGRGRWHFKCGDAAGRITTQGYVQVSIDARRYLGHRLAWLYMTGSWPTQLIDHRDGNRSNNRWENLRDASRQINQQNRRTACKGKACGLIGAFQVGSRFKASIRVDGKTTHLGYFDTASQAHEAYVRAKRQYHAGCTI